jgi:hypothetical protein
MEKTGAGRTGGRWKWGRGGRSEWALFGLGGRKIKEGGQSEGVGYSGEWKRRRRRRYTRGGLGGATGGRGEGGRE